MNALRCAVLALSLLGSFSCGKKAEVHEDPSAKTLAASSGAASQTSVASVSAAPAPASTDKGKVVKMIETGTDIEGALAPEVVKRIIRASFPRFRACYEEGLKKDPELKGTVSVRFVIDASGGVESASSGGGTLADKSVSDCVLSVYRTLSFPKPAGGKVKVTYPIDFQYEEGGAHGEPGSGSGTGTGMGYGGSPCGCDHSQAMVAELRGLDRDAALRAIDDSLHTIGEREDAGYITDRMVRHRLRLLSFGAELGRVGPARFTTLPTIHASASGTTASTKVLAQFIFHGETTEIVKGKEKLLRAAFVVRFDLENPSTADVTLRAPTLESKIPLPVSRWYVAGGDGQAWDGVLRAKTKKLVHVIGYAGEAVPPGTDVDATIHFESLDLHMKTRARERWNQVD